MKFFLRFTLLILAPCAIFQPLGMDIFVSGIPRMIDSLKLTEQSIQYLLIIFMIASSLPQLIMGPLSDKYGRKPLIIIGSFGFALTSLLCTTTHNLPLLVLYRFFQGLAASTCLVVIYAIIRDTYYGRASSKMYSYISCVLALTAMLAPFIGAMIMDAFNTWEATFYSLALFALFALIMVSITLPETHIKQVRTKQKTFSIAVIKAVLSNRTFLTYTLSPTITMTGLFLYFSIGSILLMDVLHLSSYDYSLLFGMNACFYFVGNYLSALLLNRLNIKTIVILGNICLFLGPLCMIGLNLVFGLSVVGIVFSNSITTLGGGLLVGPAVSAALEPFEDNAGSASGVLGAIQYGVPALVGYFATRAEFTSTLPLALPILLLSIINFWILKSE